MGLCVSGRERKRKTGGERVNKRKGQKTGDSLNPNKPSFNFTLLSPLQCLFSSLTLNYYKPEINALNINAV